MKNKGMKKDKDWWNEREWRMMEWKIIKKAM